MAVEVPTFPTLRADVGFIGKVLWDTGGNDRHPSWVHPSYSQLVMLGSKHHSEVFPGELRLLQTEEFCTSLLNSY